VAGRLILFHQQNAVQVPSPHTYIMEEHIQTHSKFHILNLQTQLSSWTFVFCLIYICICMTIFHSMIRHN